MFREREKAVNLGGGGGVGLGLWDHAEDTMVVLSIQTMKWDASQDTWVKEAKWSFSVGWFYSLREAVAESRN